MARDRRGLLRAGRAARRVRLGRGEARGAGRAARPRRRRGRYGDDAGGYEWYVTFLDAAPERGEHFVVSINDNSLRDASGTVGSSAGTRPGSPRRSCSRATRTRRAGDLVVPSDGSGLVNGQQYYARVTAVNSVGYSPRAAGAEQADDDARAPTSVVLSTVSASQLRTQCRLPHVGRRRRDHVVQGRYATSATSSARSRASRSPTWTAARRSTRPSPASTRGSGTTCACPPATARARHAQGSAPSSAAPTRSPRRRRRAGRHERQHAHPGLRRRGRRRQHHGAASSGTRARLTASAPRRTRARSTSTRPWRSTSPSTS